MKTLKKKDTDRGTPRPIEFVEPEDGMLFAYANHHLVGWTGSDLRVTFGELIDAQPEKYVVEQRAQITLAWPQVKSLAQTLKSMVDAYEAENGAVKGIAPKL